MYFVATLLPLQPCISVYGRASGSHCCGHCKFSLAEFYLAIFVCILSPPSVKINLSRSRRLNRSDSSAPRISTSERQWLNWFHCPPASRKYIIAQGKVDSRSIVQWPCRGCTVECRNRLRAIVVDNNEKRTKSGGFQDKMASLSVLYHSRYTMIIYRLLTRFVLHAPNIIKGYILIPHRASPAL